MDDQWKNRLRARMDEKGFTMKSLSLAAGLNASYVRDMLERGRVPTIDKFAKLAQALGLNVSELLGEAADTNPTQSLEQVRGEAEIGALLRRIDSLPDAAIRPIYRVIMGFVEDAEQSRQSRSPVRTELSNLRRESEPSR